MHYLLQTQLQKFFVSQEVLPDLAVWQNLLADISACYDTIDQERTHNQKKLSDLSEEMEHLYERQKKSHEAQLKSILSTLPDVLYLLDDEGVYLEVLTDKEEQLYRQKNELIGQNVQQVLPEEVSKKINHAIEKASLSDGALVTFEYVLMVHSRECYFEGRLTKSALTMNNKAVFVFLALDITSRKQAQQRDHLMLSAMQSSPAAIALLDDSKFIIQANKAYQNLIDQIRMPIDNVYRSSRQFLSGLKETDFIEIWRLVDQDGSWKGELDFQLENGELKNTLLSIETHFEEITSKKYYVVLLTDFTELKKSQKKLDDIANRDTLTGLPNRSLFQGRLQMAIERADRTDEPLAVFFFDIDRFKVVNDSLGHRVGDQLLVKVAERLKNALRKVDTLARFGGDEFVVIMENVNTEADAVFVVNSILSCFVEPFRLEGYELDVTVSIGICFYPNGARDALEIMKNCDTAMYRAKEKMASSHQFYTEELSFKAINYLSIVVDLRQALNESQLKLVYQPQYNIKTGQIVGVEALIRWLHPAKGEIFPNDFIPIAESSGLIQPIGFWVVREACEQILSWDMQGLPPIKVAVNVSRKELTGPNFIENIAKLIEEKRINPSRLEMEITESTIFEDAKASTENLIRLSEMGIRLAIDDFGTGYSSLASLKEMPLNKLKIDRGFVRDILVDENDKAIVLASLGLAKSFNLEVVCEGIETLEQEEMLSLSGCSTGQGFFFSGPVSADKIVELINVGRSCAG